MGMGDLNIAWEKLSAILAFNLPSGSGFSAGLMYGMGMTPFGAGGAAALGGMGARLVLGGAAATTVPAALFSFAPMLQARDMLNLTGLVETEAQQQEKFRSSLAEMDLTSLRTIQSSMKEEAKVAKGTPEFDKIQSKI